MKENALDIYRMHIHDSISILNICIQPIRLRLKIIYNMDSIE
jgi:hypothetical protein